MVGGGASKRGRWEGLRGGASKRGRRGGVRRRGGAFGGGQISSLQSRISANGSSENGRDFWMSASGSSEGEPWEDTQSRTRRSATNPPFLMAPTEIAPMSVHGSLDSESSHSLVNVESYRVKPDVAPLLGRILAEYGDIARDSDLHFLEARSWFLEMVCSIVQKLESFKPISSPEMTRMLENIKDLEKVKFDVGWLRKMLEDEKIVSDHPSLIAQKAKIEAKKQLLESFEALRKEIPRIKQELREMTRDYKECKCRRIEIYQEFGIL